MLHGCSCGNPDGGSPAKDPQRGTAQRGFIPPAAAFSERRHLFLPNLVLQVVLPLFGMAADPSYDPTEDWAADCKGHDIMMYPDFFDSLFELADMW